MWGLPDDVRAASGDGSARAPAEVFENQRFYGFGW
jgi:hypothetical protein